MLNIKKVEEKVYPFVLSGILRIDTQGRIWRLKNRYWNRWDNDYKIVDCDPVDRAEYDNGGGYLRIRVTDHGKTYSAYAHRLVYRHFNGVIPDGLTINHINGDKHDNRPENLETATPSQQMLHAVRVLGTARAAHQSGENNPNSKLTMDQVVEIRDRRKNGDTLVEIARDYPVNRKAIGKITRGERWV